MVITDTLHPSENSSRPDPYFAPGLSKSLTNNDGNGVHANINSSSVNTQKIIPSNEAKTLLSHLKTSSQKYKSSLYAPISALLTQVSLDLTPVKNQDILVFVENSTPLLSVDHGDSTLVEKPDLVAFLADRNTAIKITERDLTLKEKPSIHIPLAHSLLSVVAVRVKSDPTTQCLRYLLVLSHHRPECSVVRGLIVTAEYFGLISLRLDKQEIWPDVNWTDEGSIEKIYEYLLIIIKDIKQDLPLEVPRLVSAVDIGRRALGIYSTHLRGEKYMLLPIFTGRGNSRKQLVCIARKEEGEGDRRIFKYSWYKGTQPGRESRILKELKGTPGVVQIDEELSIDSIEMDANSERTRSLLVLRTIGQSLCSCKTVQEFLEAMYDLLEGDVVYSEKFKSILSGADYYYMLSAAISSCGERNPSS